MFLTRCLSLRGGKLHGRIAGEHQGSLCHVGDGSSDTVVTHRGANTQQQLLRQIAALGNTVIAQKTVVPQQQRSQVNPLAFIVQHIGPAAVGHEDVGCRGQHLGNQIQHDVALGGPRSPETYACQSSQVLAGQGPGPDPLYLVHFALAEAQQYAFDT